MKNSKLCNWRNIVASLSITLMLFSATNLYSQSGDKWSSGLNNISLGHRLGTKNNFSLEIAANNISYLYLNPNGYFGNVADPLAPLHFDGDIIFNSLASTTNGLVYSETNGKLRRISFTGNNRHVLLGDGTFGTFTDNDWLVTGNNMFAMPTGTVSFGVENPDTSYKVVIGGDTKILGELSVGNSIRFNGVTDQITTTTGTLDFGTTNLSTEGTIKTNSIISSSGNLNLGNTNIITTGNINAHQITLSGSTLLEDATVNNLTVNNTTTTNKLISNTSIDVKSAIRFTGSDGAIVSSGDLNVETQGNVKINTTGNTTINGRTGIGIDEPIEVLDVGGNCNIRGYLYVQDGVIIGQRMEGEIIEAAERIKTLDMLVERELKGLKIEATEYLRTSNINIDGINSTISSTTGNISFDNENLTTTGTVNAGTISATTIEADDLTIINPISLTDLTVTDKLTIGTNTLILSSAQDTTDVENNIYTESGDLFIQSNADNSNNVILNYSNDGKVGIGTDLPSMKLDVSHNDTIGGIAINQTISGVNAHSEIQFKKNGIEKWAIGNDLQKNGKQTFFIWDHANSKTQFFIDTTGYAGFGTIQPTQKLEVSHKDILGGIAINQTISGANAHSEIQFKKNGIEKWAIGNDLQKNGKQTFFIWDHVNGKTRFYIDTTGNVAIGKSNAISKLDVNGDIRINDYDLYFSNHDISQKQHGVGWYGPSGNYHDQTKLFAGDSTINGPVLYGYGGGALGTKTSSSQNDQKIVLRWNSAGKIGIGTEIPEGSSYTMFVEGGIQARDVRVKATGWADFVFAEDYKPLSVYELEKYISANKHLPGIPSAKEVSDNGFELGTMQQKLLEKIEEQALYIIALQKQVDELKQMFKQNK